MPAMPAAQTMAVTRRARWRARGPVRPSGSVCGDMSERPVEHVAAELGDGDDEEEDHQRAQHEPQRDAARTPALLLLRREDDALVALGHAPTAPARPAGCTQE